MTPGGSAQEAGRVAEGRACAHLERLGLKLLERNYRCRQGEIDLVMRQGATLVFVEVRYRSRSGFGSGVESVDGRKRQRVIQAARHYLQQHPLEAERPCRFDVVGLAPGTIEWIPDAFGAD